MKYFPLTEAIQGYFYYLATNFSGELSNHITLKSSSTSSGRDVYTIIDGYMSSIWIDSFLTQERNVNQWVFIDFKHVYFSLESYFIMSASHPTNSSSHLRNWQFYGSPDSKKWYLLDEEHNIESLNGDRNTDIFTCKTNCQKFFKYFLIYQDKPNEKGTYHFGIRRLDLFGSFIKLADFKELVHCTLFKKQMFLSKCFILTFTLSKQ